MEAGKMTDGLIYADETYKLIGLCMKVHRELGDFAESSFVYRRLIN